MRPYLPLIFVASACSLTSSLDDLRGGADSGAGGADSGVGGTDSGAGGTTSGGGAAGASGSAGNGGTAGMDGGGTGGNPWPDAADPCAAQANCNACCATSHSTGQQEFVATIKKCVCQDPSCSSPCSVYCTGGQISSDCSSCVTTQSVQTCIGQQCASAECKAYTSCVAGC
ncbi:MAG: hypothetical protein HYZ29_01560 [Myxococcales bacterium]|nr:hypothetical protein [Myxococcales bacterium]